MDWLLKEQWGFRRAECKITDLALFESTVQSSIEELRGDAQERFMAGQLGFSRPNEKCNDVRTVEQSE